MAGLVDVEQSFGGQPLQQLGVELRSYRPRRTRAGGGSALIATTGRPPRPMPPACPADVYARRYNRPPTPPNAAGLPGGCLRSSLQSVAHPAQCHRLARRMFTLVATIGRPPRPMPPACPADVYARRYHRPPTPPNAAGLPGGCLRSSLPSASHPAQCHRLARWMFTLATTTAPCHHEPLASTTASLDAYLESQGEQRGYASRRVAPASIGARGLAGV